MQPSLIIIAILTLTSCFDGQTTRNEVKINLSGQHLKSIPDSVFQNNKVTFLDLGSSDVTFYPPLSALVDSNANEISDLSDKIGNLTNLRTLILNSNRLTTLPSDISKLTNLEVLDLSINKELNIIQQLDKLKRLPKLKVLKIVDVKLTQADIPLIKSALHKDTKIILTIPEYIEASK
jgi:Leucine-rich repeat (LRR) protein